MKSPLSPITVLWLKTGMYSLYLFVFSSIYLVLQQGSYTTQTVNSAMADTAYLCICLSMMAASVAYFFPLTKGMVVYRKYFGLTGFYLAVIHILITLVLLNNIYPYPSYFQQQPNILPFIFATHAFLIFGLMAVISNRLAITQLGGKHWRSLLHIGFLGVFITILHFGLKTYQTWFIVSSSHFFLPPITLPLMIIGTFVILIRIALAIGLVWQPTSSPHS